MSSAELASPRRKGGVQGLALGRTDVFNVSPSDVHIKPGWNARDFSTPENQEHVEQLARSIAALGRVEEPLTVYWEDGKLWESNGESRLRAVWLAIKEMGAEIPTIPVRTEPRGTTEGDRVMGMLVRNSGKPLSPIETAQVVRRLIEEHGWTPERVAEVSGYTVNRIKQLRELLTMPAPVLEHVSAGHISATEAARVVKQHGEEAPQAIERAIAHSNGSGGKKAGKATRATLEAADGGTPPEEQHTPDATDELAHAYTRIHELEEQVATLSTSDAARELLAWQAKFTGVDARLKQAMTETAEAKRRATSFDALLGKIRKELSVDSNGDIMGAIYDLKR